MHAKDHSLNEVLKERQQWVIPVYQRHYAWEISADKQLPKLFDDIRDRAVEVLGGNKPSPHFVGAIIFSEPKNQPFGTVHKRFLVDGQQRVTTFSLVLCALRELAEKYEANQLVNAINEYIFNAKSDAMADPSRESYKLWSSSFDRPQYVTVAEQGSEKIRSEFPEYFYKNGKLKAGNAPKLINAYWYLAEQFDVFITENASEGVEPANSISAILTGFLEGFQIVVVQLDQNDDAQAIFASLNGKAEPLTAFDLIRNDIFHRASKQNENEDDLYDQHWKALETEFWKTEVKQGRLKRPRTDHLIVHTLVAETAQDISVGQVANEYQTYATTQNFASVADEIQNLLKYANVYAAMEHQDPKVPEYRIAKILDVWDISSMHPMVLWTAVQDLDDETKLEIYKAMESYIVRRDICGLTRKNYNKVVPSLLRSMLDVEDPLGALNQQFLKLEGEASRFPSDADIKNAFVNRPVYDDIGSKKLRHILNEIELQMRSSFDESVSIDLSNLTIEHIIPQKWAENWPLENGEVVEFENPYAVLSIPDRNLSSESRALMEQRQTAKHAFGNLTMITNSLNPYLSNWGWSKKKPKLSTSLLAVNRGIAKEDRWDERSIARRGLELADFAVSIWPQPQH